jgi:hypothetical protein
MSDFKMRLALLQAKPSDDHQMIADSQLRQRGLYAKRFSP